MKLVFKDKELMKKVFNDYCKQVDIVRKWTKQKFAENEKALSLDVRDFPSILFLMNDLNMKMDEATIIQKSEELYNEFSKDPTRILNKVCENYENFDLSKMDTSKETDLIKIMNYALLNQGYTNLLEFNPEYEEFRYGSSLNSMVMHDGIVVKSNCTNLAIQNAYYEESISLSNLKVISPVMKEQRDLALNERGAYVINDEQWQKEFREHVGDFFQNKSDSITFDVNDNWSRIENLANDGNDPILGNIPYIENSLSVFSAEVLAGMTYQKRTRLYYGDETCYDNVFIDGKPLSSIIDKSLIDENNPQRYQKEATKKIAIAIREGKPIDIVQAYLVNGITQTRVAPLKFNYTKKAKKAYLEKELKNHGWVRKTFFNWGPFKIKTPVNYNHVNEINAENFEERKEQILQIWHDKNDNLINNIDEAKLNARVAEANHRTKDRFIDFVPEKCGGKPIYNDLDNAFIMDDSEGIVSNSTREKYKIDESELEEKEEVNAFVESKEVVNEAEKVK